MRECCQEFVLGAVGGLGVTASGQLTLEEVFTFPLPRHDRRLDLFANDELAQLSTNGRHGPEQVGVGPQDRVVEKLDDAEDLPTGGDRKRERAVEAGLTGDGRAREVGVALDVLDPRRR